VFLTKKGKTAKQCANCRTVGAAKFRRHYAKNAKQVTTRTRGWKTKNPTAYRAAKKAADARYAKKHPTKKAAERKRYRLRYPHKHTARVGAYRARRMRATPKWADLKAIEAIYALAKQQKRFTGENIHVDHIVPLKSHLVCGLHCTANLRIVIGSYNSRKRNHVWPDMPAE
jgi:hypothetical protein